MIDHEFEVFETVADFEAFARDRGIRFPVENVCAYHDPTIDEVCGRPRFQHAGEGPLFTLDGEPVDIVKFLHDNTAGPMALTFDEIQRIVTLAPGEALILGGGAGAFFTVRRLPPGTGAGG